MKPFRRKYAGKYIGSWLIRDPETRKAVNLGTKDAVVARARAKDYRAGKWQPEAIEDSARAAAAVVSLDPSPAETGADSAPPDPVAATGDPNTSGGADLPVADAPPVDAAAAAAEDVAGQPSTFAADLASDDSRRAECRRQFQNELSAKLGLTEGASENLSGEALAKVRAGIFRFVIDEISKRRDPPRHVPPESMPDRQLQEIEAIGWKYLLLENLGALPAISPLWAIVAIAALDTLAVVKTLKPGLPPDVQAEPLHAI